MLSQERPHEPMVDSMQDETEPVDPKEFLRALLHISPEDAKKVRDATPATRRRKPPEGPHHDYGDDGPETS